MPVLDKTDTTSLWIPLTDSSRAVWLCDIYGGCSLGDIVILTALVGMLLNYILEQVEVLPSEAVAHNKRLPGLGVG